MVLRLLPERDDKKQGRIVGIVEEVKGSESMVFVQEAYDHSGETRLN
jgi:hypothetical protein